MSTSSIRNAAVPLIRAAGGCADMEVARRAITPDPRGMHVTTVARDMGRTEIFTSTKSDTGRNLTLGLQALKRVADANAF
jgi:hypothetical protein